jgi:hypothetical protein
VDRDAAALEVDGAARLEDDQSVMVDLKGRLELLFGLLPLGANRVQFVLELVAFRRDAGQVLLELVAFVGDALYTSTDGGASWTQQATGLPTDYWSIVVSDACGTNRLYAANGNGDIRQWDGSTLSTLTNAPAGVKFLSVFGGRLYVAGHDGETVQASMVNSPVTFD